MQVQILLRFLFTHVHMCTYAGGRGRVGRLERVPDGAAEPALQAVRAPGQRVRVRPRRVGLPVLDGRKVQGRVVRLTY